MITAWKREKKHQQCVYLLLLIIVGLWQKTSVSHGWLFCSCNMNINDMNCASVSDSCRLPIYEQMMLKRKLLLPWGIFNAEPLASYRQTQMHQTLPGPAGGEGGDGVNVTEGWCFGKTFYRMSQWMVWYFQKFCWQTSPARRGICYQLLYDKFI